MLRAGQMCSFPICSRTTSGPASQAHTSANIGKAAHIYSAAEGGPRGTGGLSFEQRRSIENGLWLCGIHADLIDKNHGLDYPANLLLRYKSLHEERVRRERDGISARVGWIHSLECFSSPVLRSPAQIVLGKLTVLHGGNGSGKSSICRWLEGLSDQSALLEWATPNPDRQLSLGFQYLDPMPRNLRLRVLSSEEIEYFQDGEPIPFPPSPFRVIRVKNEDDLLHQKASDLSYVSQVLNLPPCVVQNVLKLVGAQVGSTVSQLQIHKKTDGSDLLWSQMEGTHSGLNLQKQHSHSERLRILVEIAAICARYSAKHMPTILIFNANRLDAQWLTRLVELLSNETQPFQTVIESITPRNELGERVARVFLEGEHTGVSVTSSLAS
jgi:energy-coupling factor transporter ATP-binding protein EcfA2